MQSYVVRVYRKSPDNKDEVAGCIEKVGTDLQHSFMGLSELQKSLEHFIKTDDCDYTEAKQIDMYGYDGISLNS